MGYAILASLASPPQPSLHIRSDPEIISNGFGQIGDYQSLVADIHHCGGTILFLELRTTPGGAKRSRRAAGDTVADAGGPSKRSVENLMLGPPATSKERSDGEERPSMLPMGSYSVAN